MVSVNMDASHSGTHWYPHTYTLSWQNKRSPSSAVAHQAEPSAVVTVTLSWSASCLTTSFNKHLLAVNHTAQGYVFIGFLKILMKLSETGWDMSITPLYLFLSVTLLASFFPSSPFTLSVCVFLINLCLAFLFYFLLYLPHRIIICTHHHHPPSNVSTGILKVKWYVLIMIFINIHQVS